MSYGNFTSHQCIEIATDYGREVEFLIELACSNPSTPAQLFGPAEDCYPAEAAEFEIDSIHVVDEGGKTTVEITWVTFAILLGEALTERLVEAAEADAVESGEF